MGLGFGLLFLFILLPLTAVLLLVWLISGRNAVGKSLGVIWLAIGVLISLIYLVGWWTGKKNLSYEDAKGTYLIDRSKYAGKQADWQYNHYRFEITDDDRFLFHQTDGEKILHTYVGGISFGYGYKQPRLIINGSYPRHHIISDNPTLYRTQFSFYYVFHSKEFGNVFFKKGKWKPID